MAIKDNLGWEVFVGDHIVMIGFGTSSLYDLPYFEYFRIINIDQYDYESYLTIKHINGDKSYKIRYDNNNPEFIKIKLTSEFIELNCAITENLLEDNTPIVVEKKGNSIWKHS